MFTVLFPKNDASWNPWPLFFENPGWQTPGLKVRKTNYVFEKNVLSGGVSFWIWYLLKQWENLTNLICHNTNHDGINYWHIFFISSPKWSWKEISSKLYFIRQKSYWTRGIRINCKKKVNVFLKEADIYLSKERGKIEKINLTLRVKKHKKNFCKKLKKTHKTIITYLLQDLCPIGIQLWLSGTAND